MLHRLVLTAFLALPLAAQSTDTYHIVFLRPSPDRKTLPKDEAERLQAAHMANIHSMSDRGVLVAAGPFGDNPPTVSGIFVMKTSSLDEARRIASDDPTVAARRNTVDAIEWTGPAGLGEGRRRLLAADPKTPADMGVHPFVLLKAAPANLDALRGKLAAAGPISGSPAFHYLLIFNRIPDDEARRLVDPAWQPEFHRWWSAAHVLPE